ncbi:hypothetical protein [Nocardia sp. NPDC004722]
MTGGRPQWYRIQAWVEYRRDEADPRWREYSATWTADGPVPIDRWLRELSRLPAVASLADRVGRSGMWIRPETHVLHNPSAGVNAQTPDGRWRFTGGVLHSATQRVELPYVSWFEQWTYAAFPADDILVLALDTGQPWDSWGSHGSRHGFVMALELVDENRWELVAFEWGLDGRDHDENFTPDSILWHRRGLLAWVYNGDLTWHLRSAPREPTPIDYPIYINQCDSELDLLDRSGEYYQAGTELTLDETGTVLTTRRPDTTVLSINVDLDTQSTDGHTWEPVPEGWIYRPSAS